MVVGERTRKDLQRSNQKLHLDLVREQQENARLRRALGLIADEADRTAERFFLIVTKKALREFAERARAVQSRWW